MKVTVKHLRSVPLGAKMKFKVDTPCDINTTRSLCYHVNSTYGQEDGKFLQFKGLRATLEVEITGAELPKKKRK